MNINITNYISEMKDYYLILKVSRTSSSSEIKTAYRNLSKIYHPDINNSADASVIFIEINEAYEVLIDASRRNQYDQLLDYTYYQKQQQINVIPTISFFYCDRSDFAIGDIVTFSWKVSDADIIELRPFGNVTGLGDKKIKITEANADLLVELICFNSVSRNYVFSQIVLKKKSLDVKSENFSNYIEDTNQFYARLISENPHIDPRHFQKEHICGIYGRINQKTYQFRFFFSTLIYLVLTLIFWSNNLAGTMLFLIINTLYYSFLCIQSIKRFHDFNSEGKYSFLSALPLICWIQANYLLKKSSDEALNNFGLNPDVLVTKSINDYKEEFSDKVKSFPILVKIVVASASINILLIALYFLIPKYEVPIEVINTYENSSHSDRNTKWFYYINTTDGEFEISHKMSELYLMYKPKFVYLGKNSITDAVSYVRIQAGSEDITHYISMIDYNSPLPILYFIFLFFQYYVLFVNKTLRIEKQYDTILGFILVINLAYLFFIIF